MSNTEQTIPSIKCPINKAIDCELGNTYPYCDMLCPINEYAVEQFCKDNGRCKNAQGKYFNNRNIVGSSGD